MSKKHILWCKEGIHDKVWGIILLAEDVQISDAWPFKSNKYVTFWGRRGAKLQTKQWNGKEYDAYEMTRKKMKKGYQEVDERYLDEVYPEFQQDLEKTEFWAQLKL
jgi:hypothetical protein